MIANPPPPEIEPVLAWIRDKVPRPTTLPITARRGRDHLVWIGLNGRHRCPLGCIPSASRGLPYYRDDFLRCPVSTLAIRKFGAWWDSQTDPLRATDFVWPPKVNDDS